MQKLRVNKRKAYITADYVVPENRWKDVPLLEIKTYLADAVVKTLQAMTEKLAKSNIDVDASKLSEDARKAIIAFLAECCD